MRLGISVKVFARPTLAQTLDAVLAHGLDCVQFNLACARLPALPDKIAPDLAAHIGREVAERKLSMTAVSGYFNMIDPNPATRQDGLRRLEELAANCAGLGTSVIAVCTGTRDAQDMWRHHPQNDSPEAWLDLLHCMTAALEIAEKHDVLLAVEPETANVVSSARKARHLLDEMKSPRLKIVMDAAGLFRAGEPSKMESVLSEAFDLLGGDIVLAHAKDVLDEAGTKSGAPGKGMLPWPHYLRLLRTSGFAGPLILHGLAESEVDAGAAFLRKKMAECEHPARLPISAEFPHDGIHFRYQEAGRGVPFFFQHGLGADINQSFEVFHPPAGFRLVAFDCRGHGHTKPLGPVDKISIPSFADDLLNLMDYLEIERAAVGGISMGAAVALNFALRYPDRVSALVLQRPAWLDGPRQDNAEVFATVAQLIREHGGQQGLEVFKLSPLYRKIQEESPTTAKSLVGQFLHPRAADLAVLLERIPRDAPNYDRAEWRAINVPVLVLANRQDPVHPFEYGEILAREIPGAVFKELTPKAVGVEKHLADSQRFIEEFLLQHF